MTKILIRIMVDQIQVMEEVILDLGGMWSVGIVGKQIT